MKSRAVTLDFTYLKPKGKGSCLIANRESLEVDLSHECNMLELTAVDAYVNSGDIMYE